jgi:hypothetical protein
MRVYLDQSFRPELQIWRVEGNLSVGGTRDNREHCL